MLKYLVFAGLVIGMWGCFKAPEPADPCQYDPCALKAPQTEIQEIQDYLTANGFTATQHCSGLFYSMDIVGTGMTPAVCSTVTVHYEGRLKDGSVFDATSANPATFNLANLIPAWKQAIPLMKAGGRMTVYAPPTLAYGSAGSGPIPPNSMLVFRVDLISVQ